MTPLFITAIHAVSISIAAPAQWDAVAIFTLELVSVTLQSTAMLHDTHAQTNTYNPHTAPL